MKIKALACIIAVLTAVCSSAYATEMQSEVPQSAINNTETASPGTQPPMPPEGGEAPSAPNEAQQSNAQFGGRNPWEGGGMQFQQQTESTANENKAVAFLRENFTPLSSAVLLIFGFLFVIFYKRKMY